MLAALAFAMVVAAPSGADGCAPAVVQPMVVQAEAAIRNRDVAAAKIAISPAAACPVRNGASYAAHVMRADIASRENDWATVRSMLQGVDIHPEVGFSATAEFLRLLADQGLGDTAAFARDRAAMLSANDARLAAIGHRLETFQAGGAQVVAYDAVVDQGSFHRVLEFIITPDDPGAYPVAILLTDDKGAAGLAQALNMKGVAEAGAVWFLDLYTCNTHATLAPGPGAPGERPDYTQVKARVIAGLSAKPPVAPPSTPPAGGCRSARWILPGLGQGR